MLKVCCETELDLTRMSCVFTSTVGLCCAEQSHGTGLTSECGRVEGTVHLVDHMVAVEEARLEGLCCGVWLEGGYWKWVMVTGSGQGFRGVCRRE